jgi:hypothetical protein
LWDKDELKELDLRRQHNERMRKAGEEFSKIIDRSASGEAREELTSTFFAALRKKYNITSDDEPPAA